MVKEERILLGSHPWRVLAVIDSKALLITETILELRWYHHTFADTTWADCQLRKYLNDEFYQAFSPGEQAQIRTVTNRNADNPWFETRGGPDTTDRVFLLSLEEACAYFGDSREKLYHKGKQTWQIDDENNGRRQATYGNGFHWWRLRSPGYYSRTAASISASGSVYVRGNGVYGRPRDGGGIRPALWLDLEKT